MKHQYLIHLNCLMAMGFLLLACRQSPPQNNQSATEVSSPSEVIPTLTLPIPITSTPRAECKEIALMMFKFLHKSNPDIYSICPDGTNLTQLTNDPAADVDPVWSPDGRRIAFASFRTGSSQVYLMDANGDSHTQLTFEFENDKPVWLPNQSQIAFRTNDGKGFWWWQIIDTATHETTRFSEPSFDHFFQTLSWSPDGQQIAYMSLVEQAQRNGGSSQIHIRSIDGSNDIALTNDIWANIKPLWSPDGEKIAFLSERDGNYNIFALYVMDSDGGNVQRLSEPGYTETASFTWSPDGEQIAIGDIAWGHIYILDLDTGDQRELFTRQEGETMLAPSWQP